MPKVTYYKPNRTRVRYFTACDAARIARQVVQDDSETTPEEVLACIAKGFGFTHVSLSRLRVVEAGLTLEKKQILPALVNLLKIIEKLAQKSKLFKDFIAPLLVIIKKIIETVDKIDTIDPPQGEVDDVINKEKCKCKNTAQEQAALEKRRK